MKLLVFSICISLSCLAQLPETDIWLFKIEKKDNNYFYSNGLNITHRKGYDNQPCFSQDNKSILYVSIDTDKQADIYQYDIKKKQSFNITKSEVSEYSPAFIPSKQGFSAVVVEKDSSQRIWQYNLDGTFNKILCETTDSVGYYTWLNKDTLLYYKLTQPHSLRAINLRNDKDSWICNNPSRAFKKTGTTSQFIYAIKDSTKINYRIYNPILRESKLYATATNVNEDFIWHPNFGLIISDKSDLKKYNESTKTWEILFSFSQLGIKKITRFNFDSKSKQLVIVENTD